jgi:hypothetical protein
MTDRPKTKQAEIFIRPALGAGTGFLRFCEGADSDM